MSLPKRSLSSSVKGIESCIPALNILLEKQLRRFRWTQPLQFFFSTTLKATTGLSISWKDMTSIFSLMTVAGASLGFLVGSVTSSPEGAISTGIPILIIMMIVGVINPSGVDPLVKTPPLIKWVKKTSPIAAAVEGLSICEFKEIQFEKTKSFLGWKKIRELSQIGGVALVKNGNEVLDALGLKDRSYADVMSHMMRLSAINFGLCWAFLQFSERGIFLQRKTRLGLDLERGRGGNKVERSEASSTSKSDGKNIGSKSWHSVPALLRARF